MYMHNYVNVTKETDSRRARDRTDHTMPLWEPVTPSCSLQLADGDGGGGDDDDDGGDGDCDGQNNNATAMGAWRAAATTGRSKVMEGSWGCRTAAPRAPAQGSLFDRYVYVYMYMALAVAVAGAGAVVHGRASISIVRALHLQLDDG
jgi:hypothetical protein